MTVDGPVGRAGAGYLLALRSAFPGLLFHKSDRSYLRGEGGDWLGKIETPLFAGRLRLLGYGSDTEVDAATRTEADSIAEPPRNNLSWNSRSFGLGWTRQFGSASIDVRMWSAVGDAAAGWTGSDSLQEHLSAGRDDEGLAAIVEWTGGGKRTVAGIRWERSRTSYKLRSNSTAARTLALDSRLPVSAAFVQHARALSAHGKLDLSLAGAVTDGAFYGSPGAQIAWSAGDRIDLSAAYTRRHQFAQSLRNPESFVSNIFPVDLYVGAGKEGVPVARSDLGMVAIESRPADGARLAAQAYARAFDGLALVAPLDADPFATTGFAEGSGFARGAAIEGAAHGTHHAILVSYGYQHLRLEYADTSYVPGHSAAHSIEAGITVFTNASSSVRLGITSLIGRRATAAHGTVEWEACNLYDHGCEISGSLGDRAEPLGTTRLPAYFRLDLGVRKHWRVKAAGREVQLAVFATATNLLGRKNVLAVTVDPSTGQRTQVEMRPRSPLVVGLDWRF